jgi:hypothetical protein
LTEAERLFVEREGEEGRGTEAAGSVDSVRVEGRGMLEFALDLFCAFGVGISRFVEEAESPLFIPASLWQYEYKIIEVKISQKNSLKIIKKPAAARPRQRASSA